MIADDGEDTSEAVDVLARERFEEELPQDVDVTGEHPGEHVSSRLGDGHRHAPVVLRGRAASDQSGLTIHHIIHGPQAGQS